jgi:hypothetical protein
MSGAVSEFQIPDSRFQISNFHISNLKSQISDLKSQISDLFNYLRFNAGTCGLPQLPLPEFVIDQAV